MIRVLGWASIVVTLLMLGFVAGYHCALHWGDPKLMAECAMLRIKNMLGSDPAYAESSEYTLSR